jgi:hypothetical protein
MQFTGRYSPWAKGPPSLKGIRRPSPDPVDTSRWKVQEAYYQMLGYLHDEMDTEAYHAERRCAAEARRLRAFYDKEPRLGRDAAEAAIAWAVVYARGQFDAALPPPTAGGPRARRTSLEGCEGRGLIAPTTRCKKTRPLMPKFVPLKSITYAPSSTVTSY